MRYLQLTIISLLLPIGVFSQIFEGMWKGKVDNADTTFAVELYLRQKNDTISGLMSLPEFLRVIESELSDSVLTLISYKQEVYKLENFFISNDVIKTNFKHHGKLYQVELKKEGKIIKRPQDPKKPYPYKSEDIFFFNKNDSVKLAGTLTIPNGKEKFPAVILISGNDPSDRNCEGNHHRSFLVLADYLTKNGIAVLRYDDRGVNQSKGNFGESTILDFSGDVISAQKYLCTRQEIDTNKIGLIGWSEGGVVSGITASKYNKTGFIVLLASPGIPLKEDYTLQRELEYKAGDLTKETYEFTRKIDELRFRMLENNVDIRSAKDSLFAFWKKNKKLLVSSEDKNNQQKDDFGYLQLMTSISLHEQFNIKCKPSDYFEKVTCPVLSLNGSNDILVPAKINQDAIRMALTKAGNTNFKIIEIEGLNHAFQECKTGSLKESFEIEQTFSPNALNIIKDWILDICKKQ